MALSSRAQDHGPPVSGAIRVLLRCLHEKHLLAGVDRLVAALAGEGSKMSAQRLSQSFRPKGNLRISIAFSDAHNPGRSLVHRSPFLARMAFCITPLRR